MVEDVGQADWCNVWIYALIEIEGAYRCRKNLLSLAMLNILTLYSKFTGINRQITWAENYPRTWNTCTFSLFKQPHFQWWLDYNLECFYWYFQWHAFTTYSYILILSQLFKNCVNWVMNKRRKVYRAREQSFEIMQT